MHVLLTGGCGFIGVNLTRRLRKEGEQVTVLDNLSTGNRKPIDALGASVIVGDVREPEDWIPLAGDIDAIIHLAANTHVPQSIEHPELDMTVNVLGTFNALMAAREKNVSRFVFASSNAPLGKQESPVSESKIPLPISPYGASKLAGEAYCSAFHASYGVDTVVLRFSNVYGPQSAHKSSVVSKFIHDSARTGEITIYGDGNQTRDLIYVGDLVDGITLALRSPNSSGELFQIGTGIETSINRLAELTAELFPKEIKVIHVPARRGDIYQNYSDISKARSVLGFEPKTSLDVGLKQTYEWFVENLRNQ